MNPDTDTSASAAAVKSLAAVGFVTLIAAGIWLAVIAARYIPDVVGTIGSAAVSLSQIFMPEGPATTATSTPPVSTTTPATTGTSTPATSTPATSTPPKKTVSVPRTPGKETTGTIPMTGVAPVSLYGLPDLIVVIDSTGYLASTTADSFVPTTTVPTGSRPAVRFTIRNVGTNVATAWRFRASLPTQATFLYESPLQQALAPGDRIQYTLGYDQPRFGSQPISITANYDNGIAESNTQNNSATTTIIVTGS